LQKKAESAIHRDARNAGRVDHREAISPMCDTHDTHDVSNQTQSADPRSGYRLAEGWPFYPEDMQFEMGSGVAVDGAGVIYLFTRDVEHWAAHPLAMRDKMGKSSISMFDRDGHSRQMGAFG